MRCRYADNENKEERIIASQKCGSMEGAGSRVVSAVVLMVVCGAAILCPHRALGQQPPCQGNERNHSDCCPCQDESLVCLMRCPERYYVMPPPLVNVCSDAIDSNASTTPPSSSLVRCSACHESCSSCTGRRPEDCKDCANDSKSQEVNGTMRCVPQSSSSDPDVGAIVGGTITAVVVVVVAVVVGVLLYRRRRRMNMESGPRRSISTLMGPRTKAASPAVGNVDPETEESVERAVKKEKTASEVSSPRESVYENVEASVPKLEAIQQGHDNITRYSPDPTFKEGQGQSKKAGTGSLEDEEVKNLPPAPPPPETTPLSPPQDTYEIVETPAPRPKPQAKPKPQPKSSPGAQAAPSQSYEIMDFPIRSGTARSGDAQVVKGSVTVLRTGPTGKQKRRTFVETSTTSSLPNPKASSSCPVLPKFPSEEYQETQVRRHESQSRLKHPPSSARTLHEEPEDDYENAPSKKKKANTRKQELSGPGEDCQDTGPREKLVPQVPDQGRGSGLVNPAMVVLDEPQGVYGNQDVVDDHTGYRNTPIIPPQGTVGTDDSNEIINSKEKNDANDQPTYGNDVSDDDDHDYQNCPRPRSKP